MEARHSSDRVKVNISSIERANGVDVLAIGSTAIYGEGNPAELNESLPLDIDHAEAIRKVRFSDEIISALAERGDISGEPNPRRELLERMGMGDAMQGRRNSVTKSVYQLHELGIIQTKKTLTQGDTGQKHEIFVPLDKSENWIKLKEYMLDAYQSWREAEGLEPIPLVKESENASD